MYKYTYSSFSKFKKNMVEMEKEIVYETVVKPNHELPGARALTTHCDVEKFQEETSSVISSDPQPMWDV